jgi:hypothetical protein
MENKTKEYEPTSSDYADWLSGNEDKFGTPEWNKIKIAHDELLQYEERKNRFEAAQRGDQKAAEDTLREMAGWAGNKLRAMGIMGVSTGIGQAAGKRLGGPVGEIVGGATGAITGSLIEQGIEGNGIQKGRTVSDAASGANVSRGPVVNAFLNATGEALRQIIDEKRVNWSAVSEAGAAGYAGAKLSQAISGKSLTARDSLMLYRDEIAKALRKDGVVVSPAELGKQTGNLESIAIYGLAKPSALAHDATQINQGVWQKLSREALGDSSGSKTPFSPDVRNENGVIVKKGYLTEQLEKHYAPYEEIRAKSLKASEDLKAFKESVTPKVTEPFSEFNYAEAMASPRAKDLIIGAAANIDEIKKLRETIKDNWSAAKNGSANAMEDYRANKEKLAVLESNLDEAAAIWGDPSLPQRLDDARIKIAQNYALQNSTAKYGLVDPNELLIQRNNGVLLTGRLAQMADFAEAFSKSATEAVKIGSEPPPAMSTNYALRNTAQGKVQGPISFGIPLLSQSAREYFLSDPYQNSQLKPQYSLKNEGVLSTGARQGIEALGRGNTGQNEVPVNASEFLKSKKK